MNTARTLRSLLIGMAALAVAMMLTVQVNDARAASAGHSGLTGCVACHVPHNAAGDNSSIPLWNPSHTNTTLTGNYSGTTTGAMDPNPTGSSLLCLSCHDGSAGNGVTQQHAFVSGGLGSLATSHPISIVYDASLVTSGDLKDPAPGVTPALAGVLDDAGKVQCASCHQPHAGSLTAYFLRWDYTSDINVSSERTKSATFCRNCHNR